MANIHRLIAALFLLLMSHAVFAAFADDEHRYFYGSKYTSWASGTGACGQVKAFVNIDESVGESAGTEIRNQIECWVWVKGASTPKAYERVAEETRPGSCVLGMERGADGKCACKAGTHDNGAQVCVPNDPNVQNAANFCYGMGQVKAAWKQVGVSTGSSPTTSCYMPSVPFEGEDANKGCVTTIGDSVAVPNPDGTRSWSATGVATGAVCSDAPAVGTGSATQSPPPRAAENPCPSGFPGTVNGASVCVPSVPDSGIEGTKTTSTTTTAGVKTEVTERTTCNAGVCSSTSTTRTINASGTVTNTVVGPTTTQPIGTKCASDPSNKVCSAVGLGSAGGNGTGNGGKGDGDKGESSFGGDCAAGFKAQSDDAVINAMAEETYRQNCKINPDPASQKEGQEAAEKTGNQNGDNPNNTSFSIGPADFDTSDAIGAGASCLADKSVSIARETFVLPFSNICPYLQALGGVLLACSFLLAARIVTRG